MIVDNVHVFFGHTIMGTVGSPESFVEFRKSRLLLLLYNLLSVATRILMFVNDQLSIHLHHLCGHTVLISWYQ